MNILLTGSRGQLGEACLEEFETDHDVHGYSHDSLDVTNRDRVISTVEEVRPEAIVNAAAYTDVDGAEDRPDEAFHVNAIGVKHLRDAARNVGARLIHISTDYVFDGETDTPYTPEDCPQPLNTYGASKLAGEAFVRTYDRGLVVRTAGLYGGQPGQHDNFVNTVLKLAQDRDQLEIVDDQVTSPTRVDYVAEFLQTALKRDITGTVHYAAEGACSWYEFARIILDHTSSESKLNSITSRQLSQKANRPSYSGLKNTYDIAREDWKTMLETFLTEIPTSGS